MRRLRLSESLMRLTNGMSINFISIPIPCQYLYILSRLAATPTFSELRKFKQGCRFKQWTGDDSKALMKVHIILCFFFGALFKCTYEGLPPRYSWPPPT